MTALIWIRTSRNTETLDPEIEDLRRSISEHSKYQWLSRDDVDPFVGDDQLLFGLECKTFSLQELRAVLAPALSAEFILDWSITDVGTGVGPDGSNDDRFLANDDGEDERFYFEEVDAAQLDQTRAAGAIGLSRLRWRIYNDCKGATCLWVDLSRVRGEADPLVRAIRAHLPGPTRVFWQGRSSFAIGFNSVHDLRRVGAFGLSVGLRAILDNHEDVADYLVFQVGSRSVSLGGDLMNQMLDFIIDNDKQTKARRGQRDGRRSPLALTMKSSSQSARSNPTVVVSKKSRAAPWRELSKTS